MLIGHILFHASVFPVWLRMLCAAMLAQCTLHKNKPYPLIKSQDGAGMGQRIQVCSPGGRAKLAVEKKGGPVCAAGSVLLEGGDDDGDDLDIVTFEVKRTRTAVTAISDDE